MTIDDMTSDAGWIMGHGYEGRPIEEYVSDLIKWGADLVVDVRLNPISRKKGFSKRKLAETLAAQGIEYQHRPELGNPKDNRDGFWSPGSEAHREARKTFARLLDGEDQSASIRDLAELASARRVVLLCFEASEGCCHRDLVLQAVKAECEALVLAG